MHSGHTWVLVFLSLIPSSGTGCAAVSLFTGVLSYTSTDLQLYRYLVYSSSLVPLFSGRISRPNQTPPCPMSWR
jgi:hypothetical protein